MSEQQNTSFIGFVPAMVVTKLLIDQNTGTTMPLPTKQSLRSVVMFADISGFTNLTETLSKRGPEGAEIIAFSINRYMELMVKQIGQSGGDIFKFAGDAMIVVWPPPKSQTQQEQEQQLIVICRQAIQSALVIQQKLDDTNIVDDIQLSVKIGFGIGDFNIIYVGGVFGRCQYLPAGDPLTQAFESEHHADQGGLTIVSNDVRKMVDEFFVFQQIEEEDGHKSENGPFFFLKGVNNKVKAKDDARLLLHQMKPSQMETIKSQVMNYVPNALRQYLDIEQQKWSAELRHLTVMFLNIGIDLALTKTKQGLNQVQEVIKLIQKSVYMHEGSLNQFLMDDQGSTMIVVFGLPPASHQDDAVRAVLCAFSLQKEVGEMKIRISIGIASGLVFAGVVGTSGNRREYSVIGDSVNLAARIMQAACKETLNEYKVIVSKTTAEEAEHKISFQFFREEKFKGKQFALPIYLPLREDYQHESKNYFPNLRTHMFSYPIDTDNERLKMLYETMIGPRRIRQLEESSEILKRFLKLLIDNGLLIICGTFGIGQSLFLRKLLLEIHNKINKYGPFKYSQRPLIVVSSLNPITKSYKFNGLRQILQEVFYQYGLRKQKPISYALLTQMIPSLNDKFEFPNVQQNIKEIFGLVHYEYVKNFANPPPVNPPPPPRPEQIQEEMKVMIRLFLEFFNSYFQQESVNLANKQKKSSIVSNTSLQSAGALIIKMEQYKMEKQEVTSNRIAPLILCFDDAQNHDLGTFQTIKKLLKHQKGVFIITCFRDQFIEKPLFEDPQEPPRQEVIQDRMAELVRRLGESWQYSGQVVKIQGLGIQSIKEMLKNVYGLERIDLEWKNNDDDEDRPVSKPIGQMLDKIGHLFFNRQKYDLIQDPDQFFLNFLMLQSQGNPLRALNFVENLFQDELLVPVLPDINPQKQIKNYSIVMMTNHLREAFLLEDLITIQCPKSRVLTNGPIIDQIDCLSGLVLKVAAVIGQIFDVQTLSKCIPFKDMLKHEQLCQILLKLVSTGFIEIVDQNDWNMHFQFALPFTRDIIYQRLIFQQRRQIHHLVADAMQTLPRNELTDYEEGKFLVYHWILSESKKDISDDQFSHQAKRSIILKQITNTLARTNTSATLIKFDNLEQKSDRNVTWAPRYTVITTKDIRYYYKADDFHNKPEEYLGAVPLQYIYNIVALNQNAIGQKKNAFMISASAWMKKNKQMPERQFYFAAKNQTALEEWTIYLEFSRAKAVYDDFVNHFGKVNFPLGVNQQYDVSLRMYLEPQIRQTGNQGSEKSAFARKQSRTASISSSADSQKSMLAKQAQQALEQGMNENNLKSIQKNLTTFIFKTLLLFIGHISQNSLRDFVQEQFVIAKKHIGEYLEFNRENFQFFDCQILKAQTKGDSESPINQQKINLSNSNILIENQNEQSKDDDMNESIMANRFSLLNQGNLSDFQPRSSNSSNHIIIGLQQNSPHLKQVESANTNQEQKQEKFTNQAISNNNHANINNNQRDSKMASTKKQPQTKIYFKQENEFIPDSEDEYLNKDESNFSGIGETGQPYQPQVPNHRSTKHQIISILLNGELANSNQFIETDGGKRTSLDPQNHFKNLSQQSSDSMGDEQQDDTSILQEPKSKFLNTKIQNNKIVSKQNNSEIFNYGRNKEPKLIHISQFNTPQHNLNEILATQEEEENENNKYSNYLKASSNPKIAGELHQQKSKESISVYTKKNADLDHVFVLTQNPIQISKQNFRYVENYSESKFQNTKIFSQKFNSNVEPPIDRSRLQKGYSNLVNPIINQVFSKHNAHPPSSSHFNQTLSPENNRGNSSATNMINLNSPVYQSIFKQLESYSENNNQSSSFPNQLKLNTPGSVAENYMIDTETQLTSSSQREFNVLSPTIGKLQSNSQFPLANSMYMSNNNFLISPFTKKPNVNNSDPSLAYVVRNSYPVQGDYFMLQSGASVQINKVIDNQLYQISFQGKVGIFQKQYFQIQNFG